MGALDPNPPTNWFNVKSEAMATGLIVFENGVRATLQIGTPSQDMITGVRLYGEKGFIEVQWDGEVGQHAIYGQPGWIPPATGPVDQDAIMTRLVGDVIDGIVKGTEPQISSAKALRATEIVFALYESVRRRARVDLPIDIRDNPFHAMLDKGIFN
jgi:UDP-N-acetyl-2-amino-2-deoxyglucuronate dehydrogenase